MKKAVLPQPKRRKQPPLLAPDQASLKAAAGSSQADLSKTGQLVEVVKGELAGARGVLIMADKMGRWLIKLDGMPPGVVLSIPRSGLRPISAEGR